MGDYTSAGVTHGFLLSGGNFTTIDFPGATFGYASGIMPSGDIVGTYFNGVSHGYLLSDGDFTSFDFPGPTFTKALGINPRGDIVGRHCGGATPPTFNAAFTLDGTQTPEPGTLALFGSGLALLYLRTRKRSL